MSRGSSTFGHRLRMYLIGVSIGVILLGFFWASRNQAAQRAAQQAASEQAAPANGTPAETGTPGDASDGEAP